MTRARVCALALAGALAVGGCGSSDSGSDSGGAPELKASGAYVPRPVMDDMAGGFLVVENEGGTADRLTRVTSDLSDTVELHETVDRQMRQVTSFPIPADGELALSRGGKHLMFLDLARRPAEGDKVSVELHFEKSDPIKLSVPVKATNYTPPK
ncbi:copper chaperone PCu(A)C [Streptomyces sp. Z26]|uniref:copper chaperone PCu(A)C n=1 Tax=Streptomyces sp. Z26 TaxID=2500177 RepID=UPI000EF14B1D|nr:copper chaperone PCu(A)C [Streptomyces sp. Z26]RLL67909.1 copper chaperone PCu(A)C [Streptomyces sp. Z26]